ncbi:hypothetical protein Adeg_1768 [Ammonifex degensii KC4]|uniref:ATP-binding protein n=1 Tax=Ammonifex degensii (strain DSM 10501 / KC4) TaxID=429009 RepID=C9R978_AMMDK|nr:BREX system ATP-binding domain-containing protein [Ammonifex degensii]ACX52857.1 hypothetical protein Adeg_1768 [Ammonifex degensii KC4]
MRDYQAVATIEALRSGVTSRHLAAIFSYGREALLERVEHDLEEVAREGHPRALLLRGNFGEGKTHFLNLIFNRAREKNFVVSFVALNKETPFNRLDRVYPKVVAGTYLPGVEEPGFEALLRDLCSGHPLTEDLLATVREELHPKLFHVLENYLATGDTYHQHLLYSDLAGEWLPPAQLKSLHRLNFGRALKIPPFRPQADAWDYFRFLAQLIKKRGFAGWVLLFDEFELMGVLGIAARSEAYVNLARFLFPQEKEELPYTYTVFGIADQLWTLRLLPPGQRRPDKEEVTARFRVKGEPEKAERARQAIDTLLRDAVDLNPLSSSEIQMMLSKVVELHARAYGWQPEVDPAELLQKLLSNLKAQRLRTKIRYAVEYLDLKYLYREELEVEAREFEEGALEEGAATEEA